MNLLALFIVIILALSPGVLPDFGLRGKREQDDEPSKVISEPDVEPPKVIIIKGGAIKITVEVVYTDGTTKTYT